MTEQYIKVRVTAGAKREVVEKTVRGFRMSVKEPAEENRANVRVRQLLARELSVPVSAVKFVSGHHTPSKMFSVRTQASQS